MVMNKYISLIEEYIYWMQLGYTNGYITSQISMQKNSLYYKAKLISNAMVLLRNDYPKEYENYISLKK